MSEMKKILEVNIGYGDICRELIQNADVEQVYDAKSVKVIKYTYSGDYDVDYIYTREDYDMCIYVSIHYYDTIEINDEFLDPLLQQVEKLALDLLDFPVDILDLPDKLKQKLNIRILKLK